MKNFLAFALTLFITYTTAAQSIVSKAYHFAIGDTLSYIVCDTTNITPGPAGAAQTWNYTSLTKTSETKLRIKAVADAFNGNKYPGATYAEVTSDGITTFRKVTDTGCYTLAAYNGTASYTVDSNTMLDAFKPLAYLQQRTDSYTTDGNASGIDFWGDGTVTMLVDGYGTLSTPAYSNIPVLRLKVQSIEYDTIGTITTTINYSTSYMWFDTLHAAPLLRMDSFYVHTAAQDYEIRTVFYLAKSHPAGISTVTANKQPLLCAFDKDRLIILSGIAPGKTYDMVLTDEAGKVMNRQCVSARRGTTQIELGMELPVGVYVISMHGRDDNSLVTAKVLKR